MSGIDDRTALEADPMGWNDQGLFGAMGRGSTASEGCLGRGAHTRGLTFLVLVFAFRAHSRTGDFARKLPSGKPKKRIK